MTEPSNERALSYAERALLTEHELSGRDGSHNLRCVLSVAADADLARLERSVLATIASHEALRSLYTVSARGFRRVVTSRTGELKVWQGRFPDLASCHAELARRSLLPFALERELPVRFELLLADVAGNPQRLLLLCAHHVAADYASLQRLVAELEARYQHHAVGAQASLEVRAAREANYLASSAFERDLGYFRELLVAPPAPLALAQPRATPIDRAGAELRQPFEPATVRALTTAARQWGVTPFAITLTAYALSLGEHAAVDDLVIGTPLDADPERARLGGVGYFVNTVPLRFRLTGDASFELRVRGTQRQLARAIAHGRLPFAQLVAQLGLSGDRTAPAVYQTMMTWLRFAPEFLRPPEPGRLLLDVVALAGVQPAAVSHALVLSVEDRGDELIGIWGFRQASFSALQVHAFATQLELRLREWLARPALPLALAPAFEPAREQVVI